MCEGKDIGLPSYIGDATYIERRNFMKYKKVLSVFLTVLTMLNITPAFAESDFVIEPVTTADISGKMITIQGIVPAPNAKVYIQISKTGAELYDEDGIYIAKTVVSGADGSFSAVCEMPDADRATGDEVEGNYTLYAGTSGFEKKTMEFVYLTDESKEDFFEALNGMTCGADMKNLFANPDNELALKGYDILYSEFNSLNDILKAKVYSVVKNEGTAFDEENISRINEAVIAMRLNGLSNTTDAAAILEDADIKTRCNLEYNGTIYENEEQATKELFLELMLSMSQRNGFENVRQLENLYIQSMVLKQIDESHYSVIYHIIEDNSEALMLDGTSEMAVINSLTDEQKTSVMKELKSISTNIKDADELKKLLDEAYNNYLKNIKITSTVNTGSSGGGGGGFSVGGGAIQLPVTVEPDSESVSSKDFNDLAGYEWAEEAIEALAEADVVSGYGDGSFGPERNITRAEFVKMLIDAFELTQSNAECSANDVPGDDWSYKYVATAYALGITSGVDAENFGKNSPITREEAAAFLHRTAVRAYLPIERKQREAFADYDKISEWAKNSVDIMYEAGIINGMENSCFVPRGLTTRAQAAKMIFELYKYIA